MILVVDDEPLLLQMFVLALKQYEVVVFSSARKALESEGPYSLAILDVMMPEMNGPSLAVELRKKFPQLKVIFITGFSDEEIPGKLLKKPFHLSELCAIVKGEMETNDEGHIQNLSEL